MFCVCNKVFISLELLFVEFANVFFVVEKFHVSIDINFDLLLLFMIIPLTALKGYSGASHVIGEEKMQKLHNLNFYKT
jgi:hypothetical protein